MKILLFGDERGLPVLLQKIPFENISGIVCASIRPQHIKLIESLAEKHYHPFLIQPKPKDKGYSNFVKAILEMRPDLIWVYSYSMILQDDVLLIPKMGAINIHGALLPKYRGANPTQWAILKGEFETGSTLHLMSSGIDEGPVIDQIRIPLFFEDTWKDVFLRNENAAQLLISRNLTKILEGSWVAHAQNESEVGFCRRRTKADGLFSWSQATYRIYNLIRALVNPLPGAFYINSFGAPVIIDEYLPIKEIIKRKYGSIGNQEFFYSGIVLAPMQEEISVLNFSKVVLQNDVISFEIKCKKDDCLIGFFCLTNFNWHSRHAYLQIDIGTVEENLFKNSLEALCHLALTELNINKVSVYLSVKDTRLISLFNKNGFSTLGLQNKGLYVNNEWINACHMNLIIE